MSQIIRRRKNRLLFTAAAFAASAVCTSYSSASPYINMVMLGKDISQGGSTFTSNLNINNGDTVIYQVLAFLAPTGTTNATATGDGRTITAKSNNTDGINSLTFDAYELTSDQIQVDFKNAAPPVITVSSYGNASTLSPAEGLVLNTSPANSSWKNGTGASGGHLGHQSVANLPGARTGSNNDLLAIRPVLPPGTFRSITSTQAIASIGTGLFVVSSLGTGTSSVVKLRYTPNAGGQGGSGGGLKINGGRLASDAMGLSDGEEAGADPFLGFTGLTLTTLTPISSTWNVDAPGTWTQSANWTNGSPNNTATGAILGPIITAPRTITVDASVTVGALTFNSNNAYTLSGGGTINLGGSAVITVSTGSHAIASSLALNNTASIILNSSNTALSISGTISGTGGLVATGSGTLILSGSNTYTGGTSLSGVIVNINSDAALGNPSGPLSLLSATLQTAASISSTRLISLISTGGTIDTNGFNSTLAGNIISPGGLTKIGSGTLQLGGSNSFTGATTLTTGTLQAAAASAFSPSSVITLNPGTTLDLNSFNQSIPGLLGSGSIILGSATLTTGSSNSNSTFSGTITGSGGLTKTGTGILTLAASTTYSGATTIQSGALIAGALNVLSPSSAYTLSAANAGIGLSSFDQSIGSLSGSGSVNVGSATLTVGGDNTNTSFSGNLNTASGNFVKTGSGDMTISGSIGGSGNVLKTGSGDMTLSGTNTYTGNTNVSGGRLIISGSIANPTSARALSGGTLQFNGGNLSLGSGSLRADAGGIIQYNGSNVSGGFLRGPGTHTILPGATSTFTGVSVLSGTVIQQNGVTTFSSFTNNGSITNNSPLTWDGGSNGVSGSLTVNNTANIDSVDNSGQMTIASTGTVNNSQTNLTSGGGSHITLNSGAHLNLLSSTTLELNGALLTNNGSVSGDVNAHFNSAIAGSGSFTNVNLYENSQITGSISAQTIKVQDGATASASGATLTANTLSVLGSGQLAIPAGRNKTLILSSLSIGPTATLDLNDNAIIINYGSDTTNAIRDAIRNLLINGRNAGPASPAPWNGTGGITSSYAHTNGNGFNLAIGYADNAQLALHNAAGSYTSFAGQTVSSNCILIQMTRGADLNLDGVVNGSDVTIIGSHFNQPGSGQWQFGDFDYSGMCDGNDVTVLGSTFGQSTPTLSPAQLSAEFGSAFSSAFEAGQANTAVPEPASLLLLVMASTSLLRRRQRI